MSCNGDRCPIHGKRYMKSIKINLGFNKNRHIRYCNGCHAGERAVRAEYEKTLHFHLKDGGGDPRRGR